jgi:hypothetical protein
MQVTQPVRNHSTSSSTPQRRWIRQRNTTGWNGAPRSRSSHQGTLARDPGIPRRESPALHQPKGGEDAGGGMAVSRRWLPHHQPHHNALLPPSYYLNPRRPGYMPRAQRLRHADMDTDTSLDSVPNRLTRLRKRAAHFRPAAYPWLMLPRAVGCHASKT